MEKLDVRGLSCPLPVLKTKKALEKGVHELEITGTGNTSLQNVTRFAQSQGFKVEQTGGDQNEWVLVIKSGK